MSTLEADITGAGWLADLAGLSVHGCGFGGDKTIGKGDVSEAGSEAVDDGRDTRSAAAVSVRIGRSIGRAGRADCGFDATADVSGCCADAVVIGKGEPGTRDFC